MPDDLELSLQPYETWAIRLPSMKGFANPPPWWIYRLINNMSQILVTQVVLVKSHMLVVYYEIVFCLIIKCNIFLMCVSVYIYIYDNIIKNLIFLASTFNLQPQGGQYNVFAIFPQLLLHLWPMLVHCSYSVKMCVPICCRCPMEVISQV